MSRVAVTGGSGKLGRRVVTELAEHGHEVFNLDSATPPSGAPARYTRVELADYGQTISALTAIDDRHEGIDSVVHLAAIPGPGMAPNPTIFANNVVASYNVFAAARALGIRSVVWASSETLLGLPFATPPPYLPVDEEYAARPETTYALGKHLDEQMAAQFCRWDPRLTMVGLRFSNVMEPSDYAGFADFQDDPRRRAWNAWSYIDARDGALAVRLALAYDRPGVEIFIIANADSVMTTPTAELARAVYPDVAVTRELGTHETLLCIDKARRLLGYEPRFSWRDATS